jgi:hypothetical protein
MQRIGFIVLPGFQILGRSFCVGAGHTHMKLPTIVSALLILLAAAIPTLGADISVFEMSGQNMSLIGIVGEIKASDAKKFIAATEQVNRAIVILKGPGGLVRDAIQIGAEVRLKGYATVVAADAGCFSACGLVWLSGARRYMSPSSQIGFHAAYKKENGEYRESGVANAEIGSFLTHLGLRIEAIRFFTIAGPDQFLMLTPERARALGIEIFELDAGVLTTPEERPSVEAYAIQFASLAFIKARCLAFFSPETDALDHGVTIAFDRGHEIVSDEQWSKLVMQFVKDAKLQSEESGSLLHCLSLEAVLRSQGVSTGIDGPSFACSAASSPPLNAICADRGLWAKDRAMSAIFIYVRKNMKPDFRKKL